MSEGQGPQGDELGAIEKRARLLGASSDTPHSQSPASLSSVRADW